MPSTLSVHFLPSLTTAQELAGGLVVLVDVLRASTTIIAALAAGAAAVIPCLEVDEARQLAAGATGSASAVPLPSRGEVGRGVKAAGVSTLTLPSPWKGEGFDRGAPLLGGERNGRKIEGFELGNSPSEYTPQTVGGRTVAFTTTNGTRAMKACQTARQVLIGAFVNLSAVARQVAHEQNRQQPLHLLCAGTDGTITREDVLFAGALVERSSPQIMPETALNDQARIARDAWSAVMGSLRPPDAGANRRLVETLRDTQGGRNLIAIGLERDIAAAAEVDRYDIVPVLDAKTWRILLPS